jgi:hypothetical protein
MLVYLPLLLFFFLIRVSTVAAIFLQYPWTYYDCCYFSYHINAYIVAAIVIMMVYLWLLLFTWLIILTYIRSRRETVLEKIESAMIMFWIQWLISISLYLYKSLIYKYQIENSKYKKYKSLFYQSYCTYLIKQFLILYKAYSYLVYIFLY